MLEVFTGTQVRYPLKLESQHHGGVQVGVIVLLDLVVLGYEQMQYMQGKTPFQ